jgi:hypothetical protein
MMRALTLEGVHHRHLALIWGRGEGSDEGGVVVVVEGEGGSTLWLPEGDVNSPDLYNSPLNHNSAVNCFETSSSKAS